MKIIPYHLFYKKITDPSFAWWRHNPARERNSAAPEYRATIRMAMDCTLHGLVGAAGQAEETVQEPSE